MAEITDLNRKLEELEAAVRSLDDKGRRLAEAERNYKIALRKQATALRLNDVPVTMINLTVYGYQEVANLRYERDIAEATYKATLEAINALKLEIKVLTQNFNTEWSITT